MKFITILVIHLVVLCKCISKASLISVKTELCGPEKDITLGEGGLSSKTILLTPAEHSGVCQLRISAPTTHVIYMHFKETASEMHRDFLNRRYASNRPCMLNVFVKGNRGIPAWKGDPCSSEKLPEVDLLSPQIRLVWSPADDPAYTRERQLIVTAVGKGETCKKQSQHTCLKLGHEPFFCVSDFLLCDGNHNCPKGATKSDEDEKLCNIHTLSQEQFVKINNMLKHFKLSNELWHAIPTELTTKYNNHWQEWTSVRPFKETTEHPMEEKHVSAIESFSIALSHYGPWGYIMLGMLICGTVLMFCGVWECLRKPKSSPDSPQSQPTVLIINNQQEEHQPPRYDDIDPPSYTTLFPNFKLNIPCSNAINNTAIDSQNNNNEDNTESTNLNGEDNINVNENYSTNPSDSTNVNASNSNVGDNSASNFIIGQNSHSDADI